MERKSSIGEALVRYSAGEAAGAIDSLMAQFEAIIDARELEARAGEDFQDTQRRLARELLDRIPVGIGLLGISLPTQDRLNDFVQAMYNEHPQQRDDAE